MGIRGLLVIVLLGTICTRSAVAAQDHPLDRPVETGRIHERIPAAGDPDQAFALYLPTTYTGDRRWPIVFIMDPRGRAVPPLRGLVPEAERLGYILASSHNTASDVGGDPNTVAINAMLGTIQPRLSLDDRRFYLFGMSGTARAAWALGYAAAPHVAGVAGFAAGPPPDMNLEDAQGRFGVPFVFFGGAGDRDYNHAELVLLESRLRRLGFRAAFSYYPGPHGWPQDDSEFSAALSWLHLMAMQRDLTPVDPGWVEQEYGRRISRAESLESDMPGPAWRAYDAIARDFRGLIDSSEATSRAEALAAEPEARDWRAERVARARSHQAYVRRAGDWLRTERNGAPSLRESLAALGVDSLQSAAADKTDVESARAAWRALADLYSLTSFYYPRYHAERREWAEMLLTLEIADTIVPSSPGVCRQMAGALRELGRPPDSAASTGCAALVNPEPGS